MSSRTVTGRWAPGAVIKHRPSAKRAAEEIERIRKKRKRVTAEILAEEAQRRSSCFHKAIYSLTDEEAAWQHRLETARLILRKLEIERPDGDSNRAYVAVRVSEEGGRDYVPIQHAMKVPDWREQIFADALRDLNSFRAKYGGYKEMRALVEAVDRIRVRWESK